MQFLKKLWVGWKKVAHAIGNFQGRVILTVFYFVLIAPLAIIVRFKDPLAIRGKNPGWHERTAPKESAVQRSLQQF